MGAKNKPKTGGRKKGTPNKRTFDLMETLRRLDCDPIESLARIANGEPLRCLVHLDKENGQFVSDEIEPTFEQRLTAMKELAQYVYPKRKAIEGGPEGSQPVKMTVGWQG